MLVSWIKFAEESPRIKLFSQFLGLQDSLGNDELSLYFDFLEFWDKQNSLGFQLQSNDYDESIRVAFHRAFDFAKQRFDGTSH
jgi:hypothetical protein